MGCSYGATASIVSSDDMHTPSDAWDFDTESTHKDSEQAKEIL